MPNIRRGDERENTSRRGGGRGAARTGGHRNNEVSGKPHPSRLFRQEYFKTGLHSALPCRIQWMPPPASERFALSKTQAHVSFQQRALEVLEGDLLVRLPDHDLRRLVLRRQQKPTDVSNAFSEGTEKREIERGRERERLSCVNIRKNQSEIRIQIHERTKQQLKIRDGLWTGCPSSCWGHAELVGTAPVSVDARDQIWRGLNHGGGRLCCTHRGRHGGAC